MKNPPYYPTLIFFRNLETLTSSNKKIQEVHHMWGFLIALLSGALMSIQGVLNTEATKQTGIWVAAGWVQLTAFLTCIVLSF